jgi:SAM-dependent methyltransferase
MKIVFWFIGAPCAGKSTAAIEVANRIGANLRHLDCVEDDPRDRKVGYQDILKNLGDVAVIDGIQPFTFPHERGFIEGLLIEYKIIFVLIAPEYAKWQKRIEKTGRERRGILEMSEEEYHEYNKSFRDAIGRIISDPDTITPEQIRNLQYQHDGFTDVKWKKLKVNPKGKSVLDLGCSACRFEEYAMSEGATKYTGLDINFSHFFNKNAHRVDLNNLDKWKEPADIVMCISVLHYIKDKVKFLMECANLTKELFILETPVAPGEGEKIVPIERGLEVPTKGLLEEWLKLAFGNKVELIGSSIVEDKSERLIYHCKQ